jgi:hypothetical protein
MAADVELLVRMIAVFAATFLAVLAITKITIFLCQRVDAEYGREFPAVALSLLIASTIWSAAAHAEYSFWADPNPVFRGVGAMVSDPWDFAWGFAVVSTIWSPLTVLLGIPACIAYLYARRIVPTITVFAYVVVVMSVEYGYLVLMNGPRY